MQVRTTADFPAGEFGTIYTTPYRIKTDALRTGGQQWIMTETCYESLYRMVKRTFIVDYEEV